MPRIETVPIISPEHASAREQCYQWVRELNDAGTNLSRYPEYEELFVGATEDGGQGKQIVIIDEFHHLVKSDASFLSEVIRFLNGRSSAHPVMFILCTSASGWVENSMIKRIGSAALSINGLLKIREMKFSEIRRVFPQFTGEDAIATYAILGGLPGFWKCFSPSHSAKENMIHNIFSAQSRLNGELSVLMSEELREPAVYNTILAAMAKGMNKLNDIYKHTGFSRAKISVYLKNLMELDLVEKVYSYDVEAVADTQKGIYRISNPYVRFYFRFLFPYLSVSQKLSPEVYFEEKVADAFPTFAEEAYRRICRETIGGNMASVGEWLGKSGSLDVVAADRNGKLTVASCCYTRKMQYEDYEWLQFCMKKAGIKEATKVLYSEKGFSEELQREAFKGGVELRHIL